MPNTPGSHLLIHVEDKDERYLLLDGLGVLISQRETELAGVPTRSRYSASRELRLKTHMWHGLSGRNPWWYHVWTFWSLMPSQPFRRFSSRRFRPTVCDGSAGVALLLSRISVLMASTKRVGPFCWRGCPHQRTKVEDLCRES